MKACVFLVAPRISPIKMASALFKILDEVSKVKYGKPASNLFVAWLCVSGDPFFYLGIME